MAPPAGVRVGPWAPGPGRIRARRRTGHWGG